jgi:hypothetical protein
MRIIALTMTLIALISLIVVLPNSCGPGPNNKYLDYNNLVILSDLSSRINNMKNKDMEEIKEITVFFQKECVKVGQKIGDRSSISFSTFSDSRIISIDLDLLKKIEEKQQYVNSTGYFKGKGFKEDIVEFQEKISLAYKTIQNPGLDLISSLIEKINSGTLIKSGTSVSDGIDTTYIRYKNHIYIFTDGYLEYLNKNKNAQFYFGAKEIEEVRQYCTKKKLSIAQALEENINLCLPPHKRDKNQTLQTYSHPLGLRDNEILEAVWRKWAKDSGFKSLEWKKY